jgi:hypothetical protein
MQITDHVLTIGDITIDLPRLPQAATVTVYGVPTEYREGGYFVTTTPTGGVPELPACDGATLIGTLELEADPGAQLETAKAERLAIINAACDQELAAIIAIYPDAEINSWPQQIREATALAVDPAASAPLLSVMAACRGLTVVELATRVREKATAFSEQSGACIGKRQALKDRLAAAKSIDEVSMVQWGADI